MAGELEEKLKKSLNQRKATNAYRSLNPISSAVDLLSNDYLGLAKSDSLLPGPKERLQPAGSTGSRLLSGNLPIHQYLESELADFHETRAAILFNSGYQANLALLSSLLTKEDTILYDAYLHASLRQSLQLTNARCYKFSHNDIESLEKKFNASKGQVLVVVESIYSMDGDEAPLVDLVSFCNQHQCELVVDEAHATGIHGKKGQGLVQAMGLTEHVMARVHTFGKAVGTQGAAIVGSQILKDYLVNFAKPFIYSTAPPPLLLQCIRKSYQKFPSLHQSRQQVKALTQYLEDRLREEAWQVIPGPGPIKALIMPGNEAVKALSAHLQQAGFEVRPILAPTVPAGQERIRFCLHAYNTFEQLDALLATLSRVETAQITENA